MSANAESKDPIDFILWVTLITSAFSFSVCLVCGCIGFVVAKQRRKIKCPMCRLWTTEKRWQNGEHREFCAKRNEYFLKQLPEPFDVRCPACLRYMKLMPKNFGPYFQCDEIDCPFRSKGGEILNNGHNRISCFHCDYDLCDSCVHRRIYVLSKHIKQNEVPAQNFCNLDVDVYPIVPTHENGFINHSFNHYQPDCVLERPGTTLGLPVVNPPYLFSTYV